VIPFAKLSAHLPLVLSSDQKRFHRCDMVLPNETDTLVLFLFGLPNDQKRFRSFFPANNKDFVFVICCTQRPKTLLFLQHIFSNDQKRFRSFFPANNKDFVFVICCTQRPKTLLFL